MPTVHESALRALCEYSFPGNIRELENILQRAVTLCENNAISEHHLDLPHNAASFQTAISVSEPAAEIGAISALETFSFHADFSLEKHLENIERKAIQQALEQMRWNKTAAAQLLGMSFRSFRYRMKKRQME